MKIKKIRLTIILLLPCLILCGCKQQPGHIPHEDITTDSTATNHRTIIIDGRTFMLPLK